MGDWSGCKLLMLRYQTAQCIPFFNYDNEKVVSFNAKESLTPLFWLPTILFYKLYDLIFVHFPW